MQERDGAVDAVVLAGSINRIPLYPGNRPGRKALVELGGQPLIAYVLDALVAARGIGRIVVVGAPEVLEYAERWPCVEGVREGGSLVQNAWLGLQNARTERALFCNPDQPLLRTEMVDDFLVRSADRDADLVTSWVREASIGRYEAESDHKFFPFGDGRYAHGNLILARRALPDARRLRQRFDAIYRARKSLVKFAWALGPRLFLRFLATRLRGRMPTLDEALEIAGTEFGLKLAGVICPQPEIVLDIDEPEDYAAAVRYLREDARELQSLAA